MFFCVCFSLACRFDRMIYNIYIYIIDFINSRATLTDYFLFLVVLLIQGRPSGTVCLFGVLMDRLADTIVLFVGFLGHLLIGWLYAHVDLVL